MQNKNLEIKADSISVTVNQLINEIERLEHENLELKSEVNSLITEIEYLRDILDNDD